ncbi:hypothetical protein ACNSTU_15650 [Aquisalimonas sp. APHAB1-3]|uniref:hypothetical protein n=1 Tax=Aquisalimonas sp. APHAB1-3 TaxID=3402080 RepID=UPI003AAC66BB
MANVEFGGDYDARYFNTQSSDSRDTGVDQRIRLQSSFESDGGVEVHARLNLMNDRWSGDGSGGNNATGIGADEDGNPILTGGDENPFSSRNHRNVELDYGYVSMPTAIGQVNIGRQMANWNPSGLTTTDDRRDRISLVTPLGGGHTAIVATDVRQSVTTADRADDGMLYFGAFLGPLAEDVNYGLLIAQFESSSSGGDAANYGLRGATLVSPYVQGAAGDLSYEVGMHYLGDGRALYSEDTFGGYVKSGFQLTPELLIEGQVFHAADGNLVAGGYDSFSSLINNSPDHNQSPTSIAGLNLSGLVAPGTPGTAEQDGMSRTLIAARATYEMMDWTFKGAAGLVNYDDGDAGPRDEDVMFLDAQAHYALTESTTVFGTAGYADAEDYLGRDVFATSVNVNVQF